MTDDDKRPDPVALLILLGLCGTLWMFFEHWAALAIPAGAILILLVWDHGSTFGVFVATSLGTGFVAFVPQLLILSELNDLFGPTGWVIFFACISLYGVPMALYVRSLRLGWRSSWCWAWLGIVAGPTVVGFALVMGFALGP